MLIPEVTITNLDYIFINLGNDNIEIEKKYCFKLLFFTSRNFFSSTKKKKLILERNLNLLLNLKLNAEIGNLLSKKIL